MNPRTLLIAGTAIALAAIAITAFTALGRESVEWGRAPILIDGHVRFAPVLPPAEPARPQVLIATRADGFAAF